MPKIRGIKPDYWTDEDIVELSIPARLLFIGLWSYACDNGHLQDKSKQIKMRLLPADDVNCAELLRELEEAGRINRSSGWITIPHFTKHQKPDRRYFQTCDKAGCARPDKDSQPETRGGLDGDSTGAPRALVGGSMGPHGDGDGDGDGDVKVTSASADAEREFDEWWQAYPKKRDKGHAIRAYKAARKKADAATLLAAVRQQSAHLMKGGVDFCPFPATWLNGERWTDEPPQLAVVPTEPDWMRRTPKR